MGNIKFILTRVLVVGCGLIAIGLGIGSINSVKADNFYPTGDVSNCDFAIATSLSYFMLPQNCSTAGCLSFNNSDVYGSSGNYPETHKITDVAYLLYPNAHRIRGVADSVVVPPNTRVDIGFYVHNYSGHTVSIPSAYLFLSRATINNGDWGRLGAGGTVGSINYRYFNTNQTRSGRYVLTNNLGTYQPNTHATAPLGKTAYSFTTIQPIHILSRIATPEFDSSGNLRIRYDSVIRNISEYNLSNIHIIDNLPSGEIFDQTIAFSAGQTRIFTYYANFGKNFSINIFNTPLKVSDPNRHREYSAVANGNASDPETKTILANRTDLGTPIGWTGKQPDFSATPVGDYYYIELMPYSVYSEPTVTNFNLDMNMALTVTDYDEEKVKNNTIDTGYTDEDKRKVKYSVEITNTGNAPLNNVYVSVDITELYEFIELIEISNGGNRISKSMPDGAVNHYVAWEFETVLPNEEYELYFDVLFDMNISDGSVFNIQGSVEANGLNTITSKVTTTNIVPVLTISIVNTSDKIVTPGSVITYELSFSNLGSSNANEVEISTYLSPYVVPIFISDTAFEYDIAEHLLVWNIEMLETGGEDSILFDVQTIIPLMPGTELITEAQIIAINHITPVKARNVDQIESAGCIEGNVWLGNLPIENALINLSLNNDIIYRETNDEGYFIFNGLPLETELLLQLEYSADLQLINEVGNQLVSIDGENNEICTLVNFILKEKGDLDSLGVTEEESNRVDINNDNMGSIHKLVQTGSNILPSLVLLFFTFFVIITTILKSIKH